MARRVNTKFLVILTLIIGGGAVLALVAKKTIFKKDPVALARQAEEALAQGDLDNSARYLQQAIGAKPSDPDLRVRLGDVWVRQLSGDSDALRRAMGAWNSALEVDTHYLPALDRLITVYQQFTQNSSRNQYFTELQRLLGKAVEVQPNNYEYQGMIYQATIEPWIMHGFPALPATIDQAIDGLTQLMAKDPGGSLYPFWIARAKLFRATTESPANRQKLRDEALAVVDEASAKQPENASLYWRAAQIHLLAGGLETQKQDAVTRQDEARKLIDQARKFSKPDDRDYDNIQILGAELALRSGDVEGALAIYDELIKARPDDQQVRLQYARMLSRDPQRRAQAIALLEQPIKQGGFDLQNALLDLDKVTRVQLLEMKIAELADLTDATKKKAAIEDAQARLTDFTRQVGETALMLRLRGQLELAKGQPVQAIQTLEKSRAVAQQNGQATDYDLLFTLARCYIDQGQSGLAEPMLQEIVQVNPEHVFSRLLLCQLQLQRNDVVGAEQNLKVLEQLKVDPVRLQTLRLALANAKKDTAEVAREYESLPEKTTADMMRKAQVALATSNRPEAIRLLEKVVSIDPKLVNAPALAALYVAENQRDKAKVVINGALQTDPTNRSLQLLSEQLKIDNPTSEQLLALRRGMAESMPDEFERQTTLFDIERDAGNMDEALKHLLKAQSLKPQDWEVKQQLFAVYLQQHNWDAAGKLADELGQANRDQAGGLLYRFQLAMARDEVERAVDLANELVAKLPQFAQSHLTLAQARQRQGQYQLAIESYNRVLERQRTNADAYRGLIACYEAIKQPGELLRVLEEARRVRPQDSTFTDLQLRYAERYGNPADAVAAREAAAQANPDDSTAVTNLGRVYQASARYEAQRGNTTAATAAREKAKAVYAGALKKWPEDLKFYPAMTAVQLELNDTAGAEKTLNDLLERPEWKDKPQPHLLMAEFLTRQGKIPEAKAEMRLAMLNANGDINVRLQLASFLAKTGDVDAALEELAAAGNDPRVETQRIDILLAANRANEAEAALDAAIKAHPDSANFKAQQAMLYMATKRSDKAQVMAQQALASDPINPLALLVKGKIELAQGQAEKVIDTLSDASEQSPQNLEMHLTLAEAYQRLGNWGNAITQMDAAIQIQPQDKNLRLQKLNLLLSARPSRLLEAESFIRESRQIPAFAQDPDWILAEAGMWRQRGQYSKALDSIRQALKLLPDNPTILNNYFDILLISRNFKAVLAETAPLLTKEPVPVWVYQKRATALKGSGDKAGALAEYQKALATDEAKELEAVQKQLVAGMAQDIGVDDAIKAMGARLDTDPTWQLLAVQLYQVDGRYQDAVNMLQKTESMQSQLSDRDRKAYLRLAASVYATGGVTAQPQKALDAYVKLLEAEPDSLDVLNNLACLLVDTMRPSDPSRAFIYSQRAMDVMTRQGQLNPLIQDTHGWVMVNMPDRQVQGMNLLAEVAGRDAEFPDVYYHLGVAYLRVGEPQRAIAPLQKARTMVEKAQENGSRQYDELKSQINEALTRAEALAQQSDKSALAR